jgi:hypothetical protein
MSDFSAASSVLINKFEVPGRAKTVPAITVVLRKSLRFITPHK